MKLLLQAFMRRGHGVEEWARRGVYKDRLLQSVKNFEGKEIHGIV